MARSIGIAAQLLPGASLAVLYSLGMIELKQAAANDQSIEFVCHACGQTYSFSPEEIAGLVN
ncbi:hypothetical protein D3P09_18335 [Paenibacillus pinisoli]|uniref:Uncharacterized protein n=1 Tax=Paenibacillus pinisoli TaxID=1276110 RepID=A0A3A6PEH4_9BACL|nr:Hsp33 family molecular chaperone HslO [Paenibacillus pinisoli]RJX38036.1 hypothetical protein D3P09_18335 [Paenibacillus pinisoli]